MPHKFRSSRVTIWPVFQLACTVAVLRQEDPQLHVYHRDIYNITGALSRAKREGKSPAEALISRLEAEKAKGKIYFE
jgi:hypothetical protein